MDHKCQKANKNWEASPKRNFILRFLERQATIWNSNKKSHNKRAPISGQAELQDMRYQIATVSLLLVMKDLITELFFDTGMQIGMDFAVSSLIFQRKVLVVIQ